MGRRVKYKVLRSFEGPGLPNLTVGTEVFLPTDIANRYILAGIVEKVKRKPKKEIENGD